MKDHLNLADGCISCETAADRSLDELLAFIEGMDGNTSGHSSPRPSKKNKKKQKKVSWYGRHKGGTTWVA